MTTGSLRLMAFGRIFALSFLSFSVVIGAQLPVIAKLSDIPQFSYPAPDPIEAVIRSPEAFARLAKPMEADLLRLQTGYDIQNDRVTRHVTELLARLDLLNGRYESGITRARQARAMQFKVASKLTEMLVEEAYMEAARDTGSATGEPFVRSYREHLKSAVSALPYEKAWANLVGIRGFSERNSGPRLLADMSEQFEAVRQKTGSLRRDAAWQLVEARCDFVLADIGETTRSVIRSVEIAHGNAPTGIWPERSVVLKTGTPGTPVTIAIWDSGIDPSLFPGRMWTEHGSGAHGIAFTASGERTRDLWRPLTTEEKQNSEFLSALIAGQLEIFANPEGPNAKRFRDTMRETPRNQMEHLLDEVEDYRIASHGTMCAFSAAADDAYIRLLSARTSGDETNDARLTHQPPSVAQSQIVAETFRNLIQFFRENNVRVVNISWGMEPHEFDEAAEKYGNEPDGTRRHETARAAFEVQKQGLYAAMSRTPSILFVAASGNSDEDVVQAEIAPQSFHLPNLIKVGAVDPAGIAATFTTFGSSVDVYGIGFQRAPLLGGRMCEFVGTSAAAPSVVNLAAKLLAITPSLNPAQVIDLIRRGASRNEEGLLVINPKRSMQLLNDDPASETHGSRQSEE